MPANNELLIRDAAESDMEQITLLMDHLSYPVSLNEMTNRMHKIMQHPDYRTLVAELNGELVGLAGLCRGLYYEKNGDYLRILAFVTKKDFRGKGIGKKLIKACEDHAGKLGLKTIIVHSGNREDRYDAHQFYQKMGYSIKSSGFVKQL